MFRIRLFGKNISEDGRLGPVAYARSLVKEGTAL